MDKKEFKKLFGDVAKSRGFLFLAKFWYIESEECILTLHFSKSSYGNYYYLEIDVFIQGLSRGNYVVDKSLVTKTWSDVDHRPPSEYDIFFDLDATMESAEWKKGFESLFDKHIIPFSNKVLSRKGVYDLIRNKELYLMTSIEEELELLVASEEETRQKK